MKYSILIIVVILLVIGYVVLVQEEETIPHSEQVATVTQEEDISGTYVINHRQSRVEWSGARLVGTSHTGTIPIRQTIVVFGENDSGNIIFDMGELTSDTPGLTSHLKSGDFFDVASFPEATFIVRGYDAGMLSGELVIKGIPQYMEIPVSVISSESGLVLEGETLFDRTMFGITYDSGSFFKELGERAIGDEVEVTFSLVLEEM